MSGKSCIFSSVWKISQRRVLAVTKTPFGEVDKESSMSLMVLASGGSAINGATLSCF